MIFALKVNRRMLVFDIMLHMQLSKTGNLLKLIATLNAASTYRNYFFAKSSFQNCQLAVYIGNTGLKPKIFS